MKLDRANAARDSFRDSNAFRAANCHAAGIGDPEDGNAHCGAATRIVEQPQQVSGLFQDFVPKRIIALGREPVGERPPRGNLVQSEPFGGYRPGFPLAESVQLRSGDTVALQVEQNPAD